MWESVLQSNPVPEYVRMKIYFSSLGFVKAPGAPGNPGKAAPRPVGEARGRGTGNVQI